MRFMRESFPLGGNTVLTIVHPGRVRAAARRVWEQATCHGARDGLHQLVPRSGRCGQTAQRSFWGRPGIAGTGRHAIAKEVALGHLRGTTTPSAVPPRAASIPAAIALLVSSLDSCGGPRIRSALRRAAPSPTSQSHAMSISPARLRASLFASFALTLLALPPSPRRRVTDRRAAFRRRPGPGHRAGTIVMRDGVITAVGADVPCPPTARLTPTASQSIRPDRRVRDARRHREPGPQGRRPALGRAGTPTPSRGAAHALSWCGPRCTSARRHRSRRIRPRPARRRVAAHSGARTRLVPGRVRWSDWAKGRQRVMVRRTPPVWCSRPRARATPDR